MKTRIEAAHRSEPAPPIVPLQRQVLSGATMGTRYAAVFYAPDVEDLGGLHRDLQATVDAVDAQMSTWKPESALMQLNRAPAHVWCKVPGELFAVLAAAMEIGLLSDGAFDIGVGDLVAAWGFGSQAARSDEAPVPANSSAKQPAHLCLELDYAQERVRKLAAVNLDLSGIAKGFGVDELARVLAAHGILHFLVSIDGELRAEGGKPDGSPWRVAVEKPQTAHRAVEGVLELTAGAVATSGDYRHFVERDGMRYGHTMDPRRGAPLADGLAGVTVLAETCMAADAWATAMLVLGPRTGAALASRHGIEALFIDQVLVAASDPITTPKITKEN
ncbi:FAD:protein FMN transferase [Devosia sp. SL43]|uniref:FAD:protein FMN transferase n=1 Tax=Devosia sp. SL43 TaxID=2806348 RepID=UPI001F31FDF5|nr:FAD:protein FMN transferase [Devosia sp. SL43]